MKKCQSLVTATKPCRPTPSRLSGSYLPLSKFGLEHPKLKQSGEQEEPLFMALIVKENPTVNTPEALPAILGGGARAFRSIPIAACSDED